MSGLDVVVEGKLIYVSQYFTGIEILRNAWVLTDGFEPGDTSMWSVTVP